VTNHSYSWQYSPEPEKYGLLFRSSVEEGRGGLGTVNVTGSANARDQGQNDWSNYNADYLN